MGVRSWVFDEHGHAGAEHLDPAYVATYDSKAGVDANAELAILLDLGLNHASTLLDFGAGTGLLDLAAARVCRRVVAIDVSLAMLEQLRMNVTRLGLANVECVHSGFLSYEHRGEPADVMYSRNALHHLPDFWKGVALSRVAATLKTGGILFLRDLVFSFDPKDTEAIVEAWLDRAPLRPEDGWTVSELATHVREEYSTYCWLLEPLLEHAGFEIREAEYSTLGVFAAYTCVKR